VWVCMEVLSALDYAHSRGIVHRDIKPSNIMITNQGQVKLMDFGIARVMNDPSLTQTHQTTGSLYYMSPEQINGVQLDGRSDLYSLAISLYEMVTGRRPFDGENTFAIMAAHMQQPPVPPVQQDPRVPPGVSDVILVGLAKDPNQRFQTAGAFRDALGQVMQAAAAGHMQAPVPQQAAAAAAAASAGKPGGNRTIYMLAGSLATVAVLAVLVTQAPKFLKTNAQQPAEQTVPATVDAPAQTGTPDAQPPGTTPATMPATIPATAPAGTAQTHTQPPVSAPARQQANAPSYSAPAASTPAPVSAPVERMTAPASAPQQAAAPASVPAAPAVDRGAIDEQRRRMVQMAQRIVTAKGALQSLRESMAQQGLRPRAELQGNAQRMEFEMDRAEAALQGNNAAQARQHLDYAERALEALEKALNL
jgi:eukaryotic-like serine/threonine-protein kinase